MRLRHLASATALTAIVAFGACGTQPPTDSTAPGASAKADCPDCDPAGPSAFAQTDVGDGFYRAGDTWLVAHRYASAADQEMRDVFLAEDDADSEAFAFRYVVRSVDEAVFAQVKRDVATIEITQADLTGLAHPDLFAPERLDTHQYKTLFEINDLLDPISETLFSRDYPHGKRIALDSTANLRGGASIFPRTIPRLLVNSGVDAPAPELPEDLRDIVDAYDPAWATASYLKYTFDNGDVVYWSKQRNQYWPFYVATRFGASVLVAWN